MADQPYNLLRSKLNRAIAAYLVSVGAGGPEDVLPHKTGKPKGYPNTTVRSTFSKPEVPLTGIRRITVHISVKGSAAKAKSEPNEDEPRLDFDARVGATFDALMQSDDDETLRATASAITEAGQALAVPVDNTPAAVQFAKNNLDMADFSVTGWYDAGEGDGEANAEGCSWEEILIFEALCCASALDTPLQYWFMLGNRWRFNKQTGVYQWLDSEGDGLWHTATIEGGQFTYNPNGVQ